MSKTYITVEIERFVNQRAKNQCEYCRCLVRFHSDPFAIEHIIPEARGGSSHESNLALPCLGCNAFKGVFLTGIDPVTEDEVTLFHPRLQRWTEHLVWSDDTTHIFGITSTGRATIARLRLNRPGLVNLRTALHRFGVYPPE